MNLHSTFIQIYLFFLSPRTLTHPVPNGKENEVESLHESYRPRHSSKFPQSGNTKRKIKRALFYGAPHKKECAIMYKNHKPLGILEPYQEKYRLLPIKEEGFLVDISPVSKRKKSISSQDYDSGTNQENDETESERELAGFFSDQRYPYIFAKFKIDSRLDKALPEWHPSRRGMHKRENEVRNAISKIQTNQMADSQIKKILNDMGLIENEKDIDKREAIVEDENMELDANKVKLTKLEEKEIPLVEQNKNNVIETPSNGKEKTKAIKEHQKSESVQLSEGINILGNIEDISDNFEENSQLKERQKREEFEKKFEKQIRQRLQRIKEEVKREIAEMKNKNNAQSVTQEKQRKKRNVVTTLIDQESSEISPLFNQADSLKSYIRRKRSYTVDSKIDSRTIDSESKKTLCQISRKPVILRSLKRAENSNEVSSEQEKLNGEKDVVTKSADENPKGCTCTKEGHCKCKSSEAEEKAPKKLKSCPCGKTDGNGNCQCGLVNRNVNDDDYYYDVDGTQDQSNEKQKRNAKLSQFEHQNQLLADGKYTLDLHPDIYRITAEFEGNFAKRDHFNKLVGIENDENNEGIFAIRQNSEFTHKRYKRMAKNKNDGQGQLQLSNMPAEDIFGPLPQGFEGELNRYKRVKRNR